MRKVVVLSMSLALIISACGKNGKIVKLGKGSSAYRLAKELSNKLPYLDPDKNDTLATSQQFTITTGAVIKSLYESSGNRSEELKRKNPYELKEIIIQSTRRMAEQKLVLNEAEKAKFVVPQSVLDSLIKVQYDHAGGETKYMEMLKNMGVNIKTVKKDLRNFFIFDRYLEATLGSQLDVSNDEIASVRHILLMTRGKSDAEKKAIRQKMEVVLTRARNGEDFAVLAKEYTEDPGSKDKGGLYENFPRGQMVKPFEDAAFSVPIGELSDIVETQYGYHILKVVDRKQFRSLDPPNPELERQLKSRKKPQAYQEYLKKLKEQQHYKEVNF